MKHYSLRALLVLTLSICAGLALNCRPSQKEQPKEQPKERTTGGGCLYQDFPGNVTVRSISGTPSANTNAKLKGAVEVLSVEIEFSADHPESVPEPVRSVKKVIELPRALIARREIKVGKQYPTSVKYETQGTCAPGPYLSIFEK